MNTRQQKNLIKIFEDKPGRNIVYTFVLESGEYIQLLNDGKLLKQDRLNNLITQRTFGNLAFRSSVPESVWKEFEKLQWSLFMASNLVYSPIEQVARA